MVSEIPNLSTKTNREKVTRGGLLMYEETGIKKKKGTRVAKRRARKKKTDQLCKM